MELCLYFIDLIVYSIFFPFLVGCYTWMPYGSSDKHQRLFAGHIEIFGTIFYCAYVYIDHIAYQGINV